MPKTKVDETRILNRIADYNMRRAKLAIIGSRKDKKKIPSKRIRHSKRNPDYYHEVPQSGDKSLKESIESFPSRPYYAAHSFYCNFTKQEDLREVEFLAKFLIRYCQCLKTIEIQGHIGSNDHFEYYFSHNGIFAESFYKILIATFQQMPKLETISFFKIRWIPTTDICAMLLELFISNDNLGKLLLPATNVNPAKNLRDVYLRIIKENPTRGPFFCNRWDYFKKHAPKRKITEDSEWGESYRMFKTIKNHFKALKTSRQECSGLGDPLVGNQ